MALPFKRVVPWIDRSEWLEVYRNIFSSDLVKQTEGLNKIQVWKCRVYDKLSISIELTKELMTVKMNDEQNKETKLLSDQSMRLLYGMSITRFINQLLESNQDKKFLVPLHKIAKQMDIPRWLVDLRHESTHQLLPSLPLLRAGADQAISYLKYCMTLCTPPLSTASLFALLLSVLNYSLHSSSQYCITLCILPHSTASLSALLLSLLHHSLHSSQYCITLCTPPHSTASLFALLLSVLHHSLHSPSQYCITLCTPPHSTASLFALLLSVLHHSLHSSSQHCITLCTPSHSTASLFALLLSVLHHPSFFFRFGHNVDGSFALKH
ncbi:hypothetical protein HELRODRAFT_162594 [Helobdella robusta]|uniref:Uncharacterized protein n=1 Tax=Helobdella robusta TaxID=6412 RepID=T1ESW2_HELRO|nr:hypothetical protein HELRODRAFT_162594 [Helobdella robusta]ESN99103.1 hypothetical protein HELRODRAFT_162594 [Helobdella robusta]